MTYLYEELNAPTRLYIKQCPHCGLKYLGKTVREDLEKYTGSGVRWTRHLEKHKVVPVHIWNSDWFYNTSIVHCALRLSEKLNIVESEEWANAVPEDGMGNGGPTNKGRILDQEWRKNIGSAVSQTRNNIMWKETTGKIAIEKDRAVKNNPKWIDEIGKNRRPKIYEN